MQRYIKYKDRIERFKNRFVSSVYYHRKLFPHLVRSSYSQSGEDLIIQQILGRAPEFYVDIGCGHPVSGSNTYKFYRQGSQGMCIDANPKFRLIYKLLRPRDLFICGGVKLVDKQMQYFWHFVEDVYSTFDENRAENLVNRGLVLKGVELVQIVDIREVVSRFCMDNPGKQIDLLNVDVEGLDVQVISMFPFDLIHPHLICIEEWDNPLNKRTELREFLESKGYALEGYSGISSIYTFIGNQTE